MTEEEFDRINDVAQDQAEKIDSILEAAMWDCCRVLDPETRNNQADEDVFKTIVLLVRDFANQLESEVVLSDWLNKKLQDA